MPVQRQNSDGCILNKGYYDHAGACYTMAKEIGSGNDYIEDMADFYLRAIEEVQK